LFFVHLWRYDPKTTKCEELFDGTLYKMPEKNVLKKLGEEGISKIIESSATNNPDFVPEFVMEAKKVHIKYVSSLGKYIHENC